MISIRKSEICALQKIKMAQLMMYTKKTKKLIHFVNVNKFGGEFILLNI